MHRSRGVLVIILLLLGLPQPGFAATNEAQQERAARKACLKGDTDKGVSILTDLFIDTGDLTYIFNQGRCFEQNRRYDDAIGRFREYLIKGKALRGADRSEAERHIAACQSYLRENEPRDAAVPSASTTAPQPVPSAQPGPLTTPPSPNSVMAASDATLPATDRGRGLRIAGIVVGAAGATALITGVALNLKVNSMSDDLAKPDNYSRSTDSTREDYKTFGWVSYGVGAAGIAAGVVLYALGCRKNEHRSAAVVVLPALSSAMAGASLTGAF